MTDLTSFISRSLSTLIILATLESKSEMSGYQIIKRIKERTNGMIMFRAGTLYPWLEKLKNKNLIDKFEIENNRNVYSLNTNGIKELNIMKEQWRDLSSQISGILTEGDF